MAKARLEYADLAGDPGLVAKYQQEFGSRWAEKFAHDGGSAAEMIMRNPAVYTREGWGKAFADLPDELHERWAALHDRTRRLVRLVDPSPARLLTIEPNPLDSLQYLVASGGVPAEFRRRVADLIRESSELFAESTQLEPGDTRYFAGNVFGARITQDEAELSIRSSGELVPRRLGRLETDDIATTQEVFAELWAVKFKHDGGTGAEIIMRNPAVYARDGATTGFVDLPQELRDRWAALNDRTQSLVNRIATSTDSTHVSPDANPLDTLQNMVAGGRVPAAYRPEVASMMRDSSALFAQSMRVAPGDAHYFKSTVLAARITPEAVLKSWQASGAPVRAPLA